MSTEKLNGERSLTLEEIFAPRELPRQFVRVPEWGGGVWIGVMNGLQRDAWETSIAADRSNARAKLIVQCAVTADGKPLFQPEHIEKLGLENSIVLERLSTVALKLNRLGLAALEETKGN